MDMWITLKQTWIKHRKAECLRKQMSMTRRGSRELDALLRLIGIDFAGLELCPVQVEKERVEKRRNGDVMTGLF